MTSSSNPVAPGSELTYTIDATNTGGARVDGVTLTDQINGLTGLILTSSVGSCGQTGNLVTCTAGTLLGGQAWEVTIRGVVTAASGTTLNNTATVTGNKSSTTFTQSVTNSTLVSNASTGPLPDLTASIQAPSQVAPGATFTYYLTVNNIGSANASGVEVIDTLPGGFGVVPASSSDPQPIRPSSLFACSGLTVVTCTGGAVNAGANATIAIDVTAASGPSSTYVDTAVVDPYDAIPENNELNNTASATTTTTAPAAQTGLSITVADQVDPIRPGDLETYTIVVSNISNKRADSISVVDGTQGLDAASIKATSTIGTCTVNAPKVTCTQVSPTLRLDPGQSMTVTITGTVVASAGSLLTDTATVTGNINNKAVQSTATTTTSVRPGVDLTVTLRSEVSPTAYASPFRAWDNFNYVVNVGNSGLNDASSVLVRLPLPPGVTYQSSTIGSAGTCAADANQVVSCTLNTVAGAITSGQPGGTVTEFRINVVAPPTVGTITATITVDPANAIAESDETNNTFTTSTKIDTGIDLTVTKTSPSLVAPSGTLTYTITVSNIGTQDASGVVVRDTLPAGTRFRSANASPPGDHNFSCSSDGGNPATVQCVSGNLRGTHNQTLPVDTATILIVTFAPASPGVITNQVKVDPDNTIAEISETNNVNTWDTDIEIGGCCAYNEFTISQTQINPVDSGGNPVPVAPSGLLDYEITVTNTGSDPAFNVALQDQLPQGSVFRYAQDENPGTGAFTCGPPNNGIIMCTGATLGGTVQAPTSPQSRKVDIGVFAPTQPGTYTNQAIVDPLNAIPEADETNNTSTFTTTVQIGGGGSYIDLTIPQAQTSPASAVVPNGQLTYTVTPTNVGTNAAFNVEFTDTLPPGSVFRSAVDTTSNTSGQFSCSQANGVVDCTGGTLDGSLDQTPGPNSRTIVINVFAPGHVGSYTNQANIDPKNAIAENDETNNTSTSTLTVSLSGGGNYVDLDIQSLTASNSEPSPGAQFTYTAVVENTGTDMVSNVEFKNALPAGMTYVNSTATQGFLCSQSNGVVDCTGGTLDGSLDQDPANGTTATITVTVQAPNVADQLFTDQVTIDPSNAIPESNEGNNSATTDVTVKSHVDLQTTIDNSSAGTSGNTGTITWTASATGSDGANNVTEVANLPVGVIIENVTAPTGWSCTTAQNPVNQVTCVGNLAAGGTATFTANDFVSAQSGTSLDSSAIVDPNNTVVETDETNNTAQSSATA